MAAVQRAGADDVIERAGWVSRRNSVRRGLRASDLSFGQWQKLALARGFMRERPLLLVLDEPTAALDAETEHALFERFAAAARETASAAGQAAGNGRITCSCRTGSARPAWRT